MISMNQKKRVTSVELMQLRGTANYQFSCNIGESIFPEDIFIVHSKNNKPKHVYLGETLIATIRPHDGHIILTESGFKHFLERIKDKDIGCMKKILVQNDVIPYIKKYKTLFAKHIIDVSQTIRSQEEVLLCDSSGNPIGMARTLLSSAELKSFVHGAAAKVRYILG